MSETEVEIKQPPVPDNIPGYAVCMGENACRRVCMVAKEPGPQPSAQEGALPLEFDCGSIEADGGNIPEAFRREYAEATTLRSLSFLGGEGTLKEATAYLDFLQEGQAKFEAYTQAILKGGAQPRGAAEATKQAWANHLYVSPAAGKEKDLTSDEKAQLQDLYVLLRGFHDRALMKKYGILFDTSMQSIIEQAAGELSVGHHISLSGEPGVAKSSVAKYLGFLHTKANHPEWKDENCQPTVIRLSSTAEAEAQLTEQTFEDNTLGARLGLVAEAMKTGRVVVLDEQNGMTADQQIYFNDLFLKKPGDTLRIGNEIVEIQPGFGVIATMNPMTDTQGNRRHGRQQQDSAGAARYTRIDMLYPGQTGYPGVAKETIIRLFYIHYTEQYGWQQPTGEVMKVVDKAQEFLTKLAKKATEPNTDGTTSSPLLAANQTRPELAECITPRDFSRMLERVMTHVDLASLPAEIRKAIATKTEQILNSDNGHYVTPAAVQAVRTLQGEHFKLD